MPFFSPAPPELPISIHDVQAQTPFNCSTPDGAFDNEYLVRDSQQQQELEHPRSRHAREPYADRRRGVYFDVEEMSTHAEFATLFTHSPTLSNTSTRPTTPQSLMQMSPPIPNHSPVMCPSLLDTGDGGGSFTDDLDSRLEQDLAGIGELGKRRGFKGAPLFTPETARKRSLSFLSFSSAFSPKIPVSPRTPRTPLVAVTNLMRSGTTPKSARAPSVKPDLLVSDELQEWYELGDPFSAAADSFFTLETVCANIPVENLNNCDIYLDPIRTVPHKSKTFYKKIQVVSRTKAKIINTTVYDMMVYNFRLNVKNPRGRRTLRPARKCVAKKRHTPGPPKITTMTCPLEPLEEPRVHLHCSHQGISEIVPENMEPDPVPLDFATSLATMPWHSHEVVVNISSGSKTPTGRPLPNDSLNATPCALVNLLGVLLDVSVLDLANEDPPVCSSDSGGRAWAGAVAV
ncbi:hypothetical protein C8J57DRAFT_1496507 [Mycena rebaudengoi]|nr:hypothetical protein C8J57DRAFT_1496507 [Mycena rebaudengoi]